jgi:hypothetical protein
MSPHASDPDPVEVDPIEADPTLERRYRLLLHAYPATYRTARGDEIVGTLLDRARPGRRRPGVRESAGLILAGLRTRTGATVLTWRDLWLGAADMAMLMMLLVPALSALAYLTQGRDVVAVSVYAGLAVTAVVAILLRRHLLAIVPVLALTVPLWYLRTVPGEPSSVGADLQGAVVTDVVVRVLPLLLGIALLALGAPRRSPPPAGAAVRVAGMVLVTLMLAGVLASGTMSVNSSVVSALTLAAWPVVALLSAIVDPRLPIACGATTLYYLLPTLTYPMLTGGLHAGVLGFLAIYVAVTSTYVAVGWLAGRRRIRT